jgi:putative tryptophan/tyrosine transport system substrate-binding protein
MRRRDFIKVTGAAIAWPLAGHAQQPMPVIGYLGPGSAHSDAFRVTGFRQGLKEAGYVEGQNLTIEYRWAEDHLDRLPTMATDLVRHQVAVIVATGSAASEVKAVQDWIKSQHMQDVFKRVNAMSTAPLEFIWLEEVAS